MKVPYLLIADKAMLTLTLQNTECRFSPENNSWPLYEKPLPHYRQTLSDFNAIWHVEG